MMPTVGMFDQPGNATMSTKKVKRRDPIAFDLLTSGLYKQRKVPLAKLYKRNFRNERQRQTQELYS
jgi:hypothetical protein